MKREFCFVCGKQGERLTDGYCDGCYKKGHKLLKTEKMEDIVSCSRCGRVQHRNAWTDKALSDVLQEKLKLSGKITSMNIETPGDQFLLHVRGYLVDSSRLADETHELKVNIVHRICPTCIRMGSGYYVSILQLRGKADLNHVRFVEDMFNNLVRTDKMAFYKLKRVKEGYDFYVGSKPAVRKVAEQMRRQFKAELKKSYMMYTRKDGNDIYRNAVSVRL